MPLTRVLYTACLALLLPLVPLRLWWRGRKQPEYRRHVAERFGRYPSAANTRPTLWIHAVSVGETRAAEPLIKALQQHYPQYRILLTHMTPTGRATRSALLDGCERRYLPYDTPWAARRFIAHFRPTVGLIMETELWPNLIAACKAKRVPLLLVNARLSEKSARGYRRFEGLSREALQSLTAIGAQAGADAARLRALGAATVEVMGNLKFDTDLPPALLHGGAQWRAVIDRPVVLCASTREGEEALLLDAWRAAAHGDALLVIVPRHPQRFDEVEALAEEHGFTVGRRSEGLPLPGCQVWVGDSMGEMAAYYGMADVAMIGGSLLDYGSQNLIEGCAAGVPVLLGPSTYNFSEAAMNALACGAALPVATAEEFAATATALIKDSARRAAMRAAGLAFATEHRGATARIVALVGGVLESRPQ